MGPSPADIAISLLPLLLVLGLWAFIVALLRRQAKALERIASALEKRG